jgi:hypothetical protein
MRAPTKIAKQAAQSGMPNVGVSSAVRRAFEEALHPRGVGGKFVDKPDEGKVAKGKGAAPKPARETVGGVALKTSGVSGNDRIDVLSSRVRKYNGFSTVEEFVSSHPKGRAYALRVLAADHKAGRIGFRGAAEDGTPKRIDPPSQAAKYDANNYSEFSDADTRTLTEVERDLYRGMLRKPETEDEQVAINGYSGSDFMPINDFLRKRKPGEDRPHHDDRHGEQIKHLDTVLRRSRMTEDVNVYRGLTGEIAKKVLKAKPGSVIRDKGYVSTSLHRSVAADSFSGEEGLVLKLMLPKGNRAYLMNGRGASNFASEHEVLLPRGSRFRIRHVEGNVVTAEVL